MHRYLRDPQDTNLFHVSHAVVQDGRSALHVSLEAGHVDYATMLVAKRANPGDIDLAGDCVCLCVGASLHFVLTDE